MAKNTVSLETRRADAWAESEWCGDDFSWLEPDGSEPEDCWEPLWHPRDVVGRRPVRWRRRGRRKPFVLEARMTGPVTERFPSFGRWWVIGRYRTAGERDQAMFDRTLRESHREHPWEFRRPPRPPA
jgi:hypothetical protein